MRFDLALPEDEAAIRGLLRRTPILGGISLSMEREPSADIANAILSESTQVVVARSEDGGEVVAMGARSVVEWYVNGVPSKIGYLGQLRIDPRYRAQPRLLMRGYAVLRELHEADKAVQFYVTTIMTDNVDARRALESATEGMPTYRHVDDLVTLVIGARDESKIAKSDVGVADATTSDLDDIEQCTARYGMRHQFMPVWQRSVLENSSRMRNLSTKDFIVARRRGHLVGCLALWDQRKFKQTVVRGYSWPIACARPAVNALSRVVGSPRLPPVGEQLDMAYVSHVAVDGNDTHVLEALLRRALTRAADRGVTLLSLGFSRRNNLAEFVTRRFRARPYHSRVYVVFWGDGEGFVKSVESAPSHLEVAIL